MSPRRCWSGSFTCCRTKTISALCCTSGLRTGVQLCSFLLLLQALENWLVGDKNDARFTDDTCSLPMGKMGLKRSLPAQASPRFSCKKTLFLGKKHTKDVLALRPQSPVPADGPCVAMAAALSRSRLCAGPRHGQRGLRGYRGGLGAPRGGGLGASVATGGSYRDRGRVATAAMPQRAGEGDTREGQW